MIHEDIQARMKAVGYTHRQAALDMNVTETTIRNKLHGRTSFTHSELWLIEHLLSEKEEATKNLNYKEVNKNGEKRKKRIS